MRLSANSKLTLIVSIGLFACESSSGVPSQSSTGVSETSSSESGGSSAASKGGASSAAKTSATAGGKTTSKTSSAAQQEGGGSSDTTEEDPESAGGTSSSKSSSKTSKGGTFATSSSKNGGAGGKGGTATQTGGTSAKTSKVSTGGTTNKKTTATGGSGSWGQGGSIGTTTAPATGGQQGNVTVSRLSNGQDGWASRYWDCCKPSCGWKENAGSNGKQPTPSCGMNNEKLSDYGAQNACTGAQAYQCWDFAPWSVSDTLSYGFAAFNGNNCGNCYQLDFTGGTRNGNAASCSALGNKTMIVQAINIGGIQGGQFDLLIPGGGVGDFDACSKQWGTSDLGARYGGFLGGCNGDKGCVQNKCNTVFASKPALKAGCEWFTGWFNAADNPALKYAQVPCPAAITAKSGM